MRKSLINCWTCSIIALDLIDSSSTRTNRPSNASENGAGKGGYWTPVPSSASAVSMPAARCRMGESPLLADILWDREVRRATARAHAFLVVSGDTRVEPSHPVETSGFT
jgi:hypothetical protein